MSRRQILRLIRSFCTKKEKKEEASSFWKYFKKEKKPPVTSCKKRHIHREEPDLSKFGGQPYRTCGPAYIIQKDIIPGESSYLTEEERILMKLEADLSNKDNVCDPMPPFNSVEQRMLDLTERGLHPFYKRYMSLPKKDYVAPQFNKMPFEPYKFKSGDVAPEEIPDAFKVNKELLEKKNIFSDFKRVDLPKQLLNRVVEMEKNRKPTMEKKKEESEKKQEEK